jgi:M6 family metalloprotease-like protein
MSALIRLRLLLPLAVGTVIWAAKAATLTDFGYARMNINGKPIIGSRPLLVVLVNFQGSPPIAQPTAFYSNLVFNTSGTMTQHVKGYFTQNSAGQFTWSVAGVVGPINLSSNAALLPQPDFHSNIVYEVMARGPGFFDFQPHRGADTNVTQDELQIMAFSGKSSAGARPFGCVQAAGVPVTVCGDMADTSDQWGFSSICHELGHALGTANNYFAPIDVYGAKAARNYRVTLMAGTIGGTNNEASTWHMDPWHKMQLGWIQPRIINLITGGVFTLRAAYASDLNGPIILYDPTHGIREFFILEYRAQAGYDREVATAGLAIWHIKHDQDNVPEMIPSESGLQAEWSWSVCGKCASLWYAPSNSASQCPADGLTHNDGNSLHWLVFDDASDPGEPGWRRCRKCEGLFFNPNQAISDCPVSGRHEVPTNSVLDYRLRTSPVDGGESTWFRCSKCQGLIDTNILAQSTNTVTCAAGGTHNAVTNTTYSIHLTDRAMLCLAAPDLQRGGNQLWQGGTNTPTLEWFDRTTTATRIYVRPFSAGSDQITVEVLSERDTWVDFNFSGPEEDGTTTKPYNTLAEGVAFCSWGGTVKFKPGSKNETATIDKPLTMAAPLGPVTIGQ